MGKDVATQAVKLSKTERNELIRLVKARFRLLKKDIAASAHEFRVQRKREILKESEEARTAMGERARELFTPIVEQWNDAVKVLDKEAQEKGIRMNHEGAIRRIELRWSELLRPETRFDTVFLPKNLNGYGDLVDDVTIDSNAIHAELERKENKLIEDLLIGSLTTDARAILDSVPTPEELLKGLISKPAQIEA